MTKHLMVKAGAGTGKTFCVTEGVHRMVGSPRKTVGSEEQQAVWDVMCSDPYPGNIHMTSFTNDASEQLAFKGPLNALGKPAASSSSTYGMGLHVAKTCGQAGVIDIYGNKYKGLTTEFLGGTKFETKDGLPGVWEAIFETQSKARLALKRKLGMEEMKELADHYGIEVPGGKKDGVPYQDMVLEGVNAVLEAGIEKSWHYDFGDMVYIPVVTNLISRKKYGTLVVDEAQDLGVAQQELCLRLAWRLILVGDPRQAIYGFAGADSDSFGRLYRWLDNTQRGIEVLPLNLTRRCSLSVVREANRFAPELKAMDGAPEGTVESMAKRDLGQEKIERIVTSYGGKSQFGGDKLMVICPTNAPLIGMLFRLQKYGVRAYIHGGDLTKSMKLFISKFESIGELRKGLEEKLSQLWSKKTSKSRDNQIDIHLALQEVAQSCTTVGAVVSSIDNAFSDTPRPGWIRLSTIHKAKGLEADTIIIWEVDKCKSQYSTQPWEFEQDKNLEYVAITRAKKFLIKVASQ